jgi:acetyltransferase-like isoleucine patch superfamily enzyme
MVRKFLRYLAIEHNKALSLYRRINRPGGREWAEYNRRHGGFYHFGKDCSMITSTMVVDPQYTWIGDRVCLGSCRLICHDGSIEMLNQRYGVRIDRIGPIIVKNDVYIGEGAIVLGGTTIGEGSIIGAGSVVRKSVAAGSVVTGNPAQVVAKVENVIRFWEAESQQYPWADLIARREGAFDAAMEPELCRRRQDHFFKDFP